MTSSLISMCSVVSFKSLFESLSYLSLFIVYSSVLSKSSSVDFSMSPSYVSSSSLFVMFGSCVSDSSSSFTASGTLSNMIDTGVSRFASNSTTCLSSAALSFVIGIPGSH